MFLDSDADWDVFDYLGTDAGCSSSSSGNNGNFFEITPGK